MTIDELNRLVDELKAIPSQRGEGCLGSTDKL